MSYLFVFLGGGCGSCLRYLLSTIINQDTSTMFPFGTLSVNTIGSFAIGILFHLFHCFTVPGEMKLFLIIGFLGGFTTFSSFSLETVNLFRNGEYRLFLMNILINNGTCLVFTIIGIYCAKYFLTLFR